MESMQAVRDVIGRHAPNLDLCQMELMPHPGWGGDSDAWRVGGSWIFRFPRTADIASRLAVEVALLPRLAPALPLPIPNFSYVAHGDNGQPLFVGYQAIPGIPLRANLLTALPSATADRLAGQLGRFLHALHGSSIDDAIACGVARPLLSPRQAREGRYRQMEATVFPVLDEDERAWVRGRFLGMLAEPFRFDYARRVCHGDLSSDHILFDPARGELTGIIDFGDIAVGDPAGEFTWRADYGEEFFQTALAAYGSDDSSLADRVAFQIDCLPLTQIAYGLEADRLEDVVEGRRELRRRMIEAVQIENGKI